MKKRIKELLAEGVEEGLIGLFRTFRKIPLMKMPYKASEIKK